MHAGDAAHNAYRYVSRRKYNQKIRKIKFFSTFLKGPFPQVAEMRQGKQPPDAGKSCGNNPERRGNTGISLYYIFTREKAGRESVHAAHLAAERAARVHLPYACEAVRSVVVLRAPVVLAV